MNKNSNKENKYTELFTLWQYRKEAPIRFSNYSILQKFADYLSSIPSKEFMRKDRGTYAEHQNTVFRVVNFLNAQKFWKPGRAMAYGSEIAYWVAVCVTDTAYERFYSGKCYSEIKLKGRPGLHLVILPVD